MRPAGTIILKPALVAIAAVAAAMILLAVSEMPTYGRLNPTFNAVYEHYIFWGVQETGAVNIVAQILNDYRAYDTLIETVVLFSAIMAAILVLRVPHADEGGESLG